METCPCCGSREFWSLSTGQIRCSNCGLTRKVVQNLWKKRRISPYWKRRLLEYFCLGVPAYRLSFQVPYSQLTIQRCLRMFRKIFINMTSKILHLFPVRLKWMKPCLVVEDLASVAWVQQVKTSSLGYLSRCGKVLTFPITSRAKETKQPYINKYTKAGSLYYTYAFLPIRGNHVVVLKDKGIPKGRDHINGIEGFWSFAKHWLYHYRDISNAYFPLYLKEAEWRFNHRNENLVILLRRLLNRQIFIVKEQI